MALIDCPACAKKISDKAKQCQHCGYDLSDKTPEDHARKQSLLRFQRLQSLQNQSLVAMLLFITGFGMMYWGGARTGDLQHNLAILTSVVGFLWYVVNRVRILIVKRFAP